MGDKFTWFPKMTEAAERIPEEYRAAFVWQVIRYGTYGEEPGFSWPLDAVFAAMKEDIDNSKAARKTGSKGGRPSGKTPLKPPENPSETPLTPLKPSEKPFKGGKDSIEDGLTHTNTYQSNTYQSNPVQGMAVKEGAQTAPFSPPTREEVEAYAKAEGLDVDAARFVDHYAANGWKVGGHAPMNDWKAAARNWSRRESERPRASASAPKERNLDGYVFDF